MAATDAPEREAVRIDPANVQGTIVRLFRRPIVRHLLFRFDEAAGARAFLEGLIPRVTMADRELDTAPEPLINVGVSAAGLAALGLDPAVLRECDTVFREGPDARRLGDVAGTPSDPALWWEGQFTTADVHGVVSVYVATDEALEQVTGELHDLAAGGGVTELIPRRDGTRLDARSLGGATLHFGYRDGISQPDVAWDDATRAPGQADLRNFVLGYATAECSSAPERGPAADFMRDSAYGAFRWIAQDVATFNAFLRTEAPKLYGHLSQQDAEELLAAKLLGRWRDGTPLALSPDHPDPDLAASNDFTYAEDPDGARCPFSAHVRVVNPRDQKLDPVVVEGVPRVMRRGLPYGPLLEGTEDDGVDRGVLGVFLGTDLRRQIYTLTSWIKQNTFSPAFNANRKVQDALVANRGQFGTDQRFTIPGADGAATVARLPDFVHTKGTAFLLYPSKATLEKLAARQ